MAHISMKPEAAVENFCTKKVKVSISEAGEGMEKLELIYYWPACQVVQYFESYLLNLLKRNVCIQLDPAILPQRILTYYTKSKNMEIHECKDLILTYLVLSYV